MTSVLLLGKPIDAQRNAIACLEAGGERRFVLSPGCDLPYATLLETLEAVAQVVLDPYQREIVKAIAVDRSDDDRKSPSSRNGSRKPTEAMILP